MTVDRGRMKEIEPHLARVRPGQGLDPAQPV